MKSTPSIAIIVSIVLISGAAQSQPYPNRPVRYICPFPAGDGTDTVTRIVGAKLADIWGRPVIVDNRPGAGGSIGVDVAARASPDGYTLLMGTIATHGINPALYQKLPYDHIKDFAPISLIGMTPNVLVVHPGAPAKSVGEFIAHAKRNPSKINYGSAGIGSSAHLSMELFKAMTGTDFVHVPYKGGAAALADLLGGHVQAMFGTLPLQLPHIKTGKVRALGVTTAKRNAQVPAVPTIAESGVPGYDVAFWFALFAPAATPRPILAKLNADLVQSLKLPDTQRRLGESGVDVVVSTPEQLSAFVKSETIKWAKVVKDSGAIVD